MKIPLFDIDGTLIEGGNKAHADAFDFVLHTIYQQPTAFRSELMAHGMIDTQILIEVLKLHGVPEEQAKEKMEEAMQAMDKYVAEHEYEGKSILMPGAKELLEQLKEKQVPMGLLTGNVEGIGWKKMALVGLKEYFSFGAFGSMAYKRVDLIPIAVQRAKEKGIDHPLTDFIIVGDSPLDISCAKSGGIQVIAVGAGNFSSKELRDAGADLVVDTLREQDKILEFLKVNK